MKKYIKLVLSVGVIFVFGLGIYYLSKENKVFNHLVSKNQVSNCLKLLERVNFSLIDQGEWEAVEIDKVNEEPVSINNLAAKKLQEVSRGRKDVQANYGPFIMEKTYERSGEFTQENNPELIKCAQDKIILSTWQP